MKVLAIVAAPFGLLTLWVAVATGWRAMQLSAQRRALSKALLVRSVASFAMGLLLVRPAITRIALEGEFSLFVAACEAVLGIALLVSIVWYTQLEYSEAETHFRVDFRKIILFRAPREES